MSDEEPEMNQDDAGGIDILAEGEEGEEEGGNNLILIIGGAVVLLIAIAAGLYFTGMLDGLLGKGAEQSEGEGGDKKHASKGDKKHASKGDGHGKDGKGGKFLEIPTILVNLSSNDGTPRYLRLSVQLEMASPEDYQAVEAVIPRVVDQFQTYLRELRVRDLRGSAGIYRLQMELLWRVNQAAAPVEVKDVLFQEILIQ